MDSVRFNLFGFRSSSPTMQPPKLSPVETQSYLAAPQACSLAVGCIAAHACSGEHVLVDFVVRRHAQGRILHSDQHAQAQSQHDHKGKESDTAGMQCYVQVIIHLSKMQHLPPIGEVQSSYIQ